MTKLSVEQALVRAKSLGKKGDFRGARDIYESILRTYPDNMRARQSLASMASLPGAPRGASSGSLQSVLDDLIALYRQGQLKLVAERAATLTRQFPASDQLWNIAGAANLGLGRYGDAEQAFGRYVQLSPHAPGAHNNLGTALKEQGRHADAITHYETALRLKPDYAEVHSNLGLVLKGAGRLDEAEASCRRSLEIKPDSAEGHGNLGLVLAEQGRNEEAVASYRRALQLRPGAEDIFFNMGIALEATGRLQDAIGSYQTALEIQPSHVEALTNLGNILVRLNRGDDGEKCFRQALGIDPDHVRCLVGLGRLMAIRTRYAEAIACYERAREIDPHDEDAICLDRACRISICDWSQGGDPAQYDDRISLFAALATEDNPGRQLERSRRWVNTRLLPAKNTAALPVRERPSRRPGRLRVGIFSADYRDSHAMMQIVMGVFREYDRSCFELLAYSHSSKPGGAARERVIGYVDGFRDVNLMSDQQLAERAWSDQLDIAIDLTAFTDESRTSAFAYRLAPIQINYLGFPSTTAAEFIDYIVCDPVVVPEELGSFYSEKKIRLPNSYFPLDEQCPISPRETTRADFGLPEDGFVFCCFNNHFKFEPHLFDIWMRLLSKVDGSVLWVRGGELVDENLRREAAKRGVDPDRLIFAEVLPNDQHIARHKHADLFVDTFAFNAHTTTSDALWGGLPVVTKAGRQFAARVAASILTAAGLPELVTETDEAYETLILELANDPARLAAIRSKLIANRATAPFFDTKKFTRDLERGLQAAYDRYFEGEEPADIWIGQG